MHCVWPLILALVVMGVGGMLAAEGKGSRLLYAGAAAAALAQTGVFDRWCDADVSTSDSPSGGVAPPGAPALF